jgi:hypothetical protein
MNKIVLTATLAAIGILPIASGQEQKAKKSEQTSTAGDLARGTPGPGTVWVDASTKIYYRQGAVNSGYHDSTVKPARK